MHYTKKRKNSISCQLNRRELIEQIRNDEMNKECFDCGAKNPEYISINNGIFLCKKCIYYHYKLPDQISTLIKNNLNILGEKELKYLYYGGNSRLSKFINDNCQNLNNKYQPELLYITEELKYYRYKLSSMVNEDFDDNKFYYTQKNFYYPMTDKRERFNFNQNYSDNNYFHFNKNLKKKYNYRKWFFLFS